MEVVQALENTNAPIIIVGGQNCAICKSTISYINCAVGNRTILYKTVGLEITRFCTQLCVFEMARFCTTSCDLKYHDFVQNAHMLPLQNNPRVSYSNYTRALGNLWEGPGVTAGFPTVITLE